MAWSTRAAFVCNGNTTSVDCGSGSSIDDLPGSGDVTWEAWCKITSGGGGVSGFGRFIDKDGKFLILSRNNRFTAIVTCDITNAEREATATLPSLDYCHLAVTWTASTKVLRLFVNGELITAYDVDVTGSGSVTADASGSLYVGNRAAGDRGFDGNFVWMRLSNTIRYTGRYATPDRFTPPAADANTKLLLKFDEGSGTSIADSSGNSNNGTASNGSWTTQSQGLFAQTYSLIAATDTTNARFACRVPHQSQVFTAQGRRWAFYGDYDAASGPYDLYHTSSSNDGLTWDTPTNLTTFPLADAQWSICYDSTNNKIHVAKNTQYTGSHPFHDGLLYRVGTPNSDGTITWLAGWQTVIATGNAVGDFSVQVASDGKAWIAYGDGDTLDAVDGDAIALRNANTDGTWSNASGFPTTIQTGSTEDRFAILAPFADGSMFALTYHWGTDEAANGFLIATDGTVTSDGAATSSSVECASGAGALVARIEVASLADGDIHLVYQDTSQNIKYRKRSGGSWGSETTLSNSSRVTDYISSPRLSFGNGGYIYVTWSATDQIYITQWNGSAWETPANLRSIGLDDTFEHMMPDHRCDGERLHFAHLTSGFYTLWMTAWVGNYDSSEVASSGITAQAFIGL